MATLFRTGSGTSTDTIICALELVSPDWFRRALVGALELMCNEANWEQVGDATVDFARDKANEMLEGIQIDVIIPVIPVGTLQMWPTATAPDKWVICDGRTISRATYADLFALIGTTFGAGNGTTTFNVPDFTERSPMGVGTLHATAVGNTEGTSNETLSTSQIPAHSHGLTDPGHVHSVTDPGHVHGINTQTGGAAGANNVIVAGVANVNTTPVVKNSNSNTTGVSIQSHTTGATVDNAGGGGSHNNIHPILAIYFMIYAGV